MLEAQPATSLADRIQADIFYGRLAPGMWLKQIELERRYACTRLALRQALDAVSNKGMLPWLWERHPGHPNWLPSFFDDDAAACGEHAKGEAHRRRGLAFAVAMIHVDHTPSSIMR